MSPAPPDDALIRNTVGIARERGRSEALEATALEQAIAQNSRMLRLRSGRSVAEMADRVGISKAMLSKIENAQTSCSLATWPDGSPATRRRGHVRDTSGVGAS